jgi:hypothetical protein
LAAGDPPPLDTLKSILRFKLASMGSLEELRDDLLAQVEVNDRPVYRELRALQHVLAMAAAPEPLAPLVAWDGNWVLDDESEDGARTFLHSVLAIYASVVNATRIG